MQLELERYLELEKAAATVTPGAQSNWAISLDGNTMSWQGQLDGDYNQDGEVGLADLVPLSRHLGERAPFEQGSIQQMLDGDGNGEVNIADVQVIARNYGRRITHYAVLGSNEARDHPADSGTVGPGAQLLGQLATAEGSGEGRLQYSWLLDRQAGWTYWVTALDSGTAVDSSRPVGIDNWCMFGGNARHTGRSPFSVAGPVVVSQLARDGQDEEIQLISTPGGVLYRATGWATVSAFSLQDDTELWRVEAPSEVRSLTATADGGLLVAAGFYIHRYTADGDLLWTFDAGNWISCPPVPRSDGAIICGDAGRRLFCISAEGELLWWYFTDQTIDHGPAIAQDGTIYCDNGQDRLLAISPSGDLLWELELEESIDSSPSVAADGTVYLILYFGDLVSVSPQGQLNWQAEIRRGASPYPVLDANGNILLASYEKVQCFSPAGNLLWGYQPTGTVTGGLLVDSAGKVYFGSKDGRFFCLESTGELAWQRMGLPGDWSTPLLDGLGRLHLLNAGHYLQIGPPAVPRGLAASTSLTDQVTVGWQAQFGTDGFELQYRPAGNPLAMWQELAVLKEGERGLYRHVPGTQAAGLQGYEYRVRAVYGGDVCSEWSRPVTGRLAAGDEPALGWPLQGGNPQRTGFSQVSGPADARLLWKFQCGAAIQGSAVVTPDGDVCFGSDNRTLFLLDPEGEQQWLFETMGPITASPAIRDDGRFCVGSNDGAVHCVNSDGTENWRYQAVRPFAASPVFGPDGRLHICDIGGDLFSLDQQGNLLYMAPAGVGLFCSPAISQTGDVFTGNLILHGNGQLTYRNVNGSMLNSPVLGADSTLFLTHADGTINALDAQGFPLWTWGREFPSYIGLYNTPALDLDGKLFVAIGKQGIHVFNDEGILQYIIGAALQEEFLGITLDSSGHVYAGSREGFIHCFDSAGNLLWSHDLEGAVTAAPAIGPDGTLYIGSADGNMYAFGD
ncbi:MAG: PQQ-binding-like beta-propeller repeat protein [Planctomycetales bacterium]|nr:PQQ-binding-like beta-propeller repeat protein [bacterium]UNM09214.1 MAG: PQQ-binding-like beta-propeller repeat protein [Planctomycetales bacterium]